MSENYSSDSDIEEETVEYFQESDSESVGDESDKFCLYGNEPEYNSDEVQHMSLSSGEETDDSEEETELNSSRLENLHWYSCSNCCQRY